MRQFEITDLFNHIGQRQEMYGAEKAFRFKTFKHKTKGPQPAAYLDTFPDGDQSDAAHHEQDEHIPAKRVRRHTRSRKNAGAVANNDDAERHRVDGAESNAARNEQVDDIPAKRVRRQSRGRGDAEAMATTNDADAQRVDGAESDAAHDEQDDDIPATWDRRHSTRRKTGRVVMTDEEHEAEQCDPGDQSNATGVDQSNSRTAARVLRSGAVSQLNPGGPLLFPTPSPSPTPVPPVGTSRPRPRPKYNPNPSRIQPTRKGKGG